MKITNLFLIAVSISQSLFAAEYTYHPSSPMNLKGGFNPFKPTEAYLECLEKTTVEALETPNNRSLNIQISTVKSRRDLYSKTNISASISGSYGPFSGSASTSKLDEVTFNENDFNWIIVLKSDMGKYGLVRPKLDPSLLNLSDEALYDRCGTEIVTKERRGVMLYALITVHNLSQSERHEMESQIGGGISTAVYSADAAAKYKSILQFSYAVGTVSITVDAQGGKGLKELADVVGNGSNEFANYAKLPELVNKYVKDFNPDNAVPLQYFTTSIKAFRPSLTPRRSSFEATQVGIIYEKYLDTVKTLSRIDTLLSPNHTQGFEITNEQRQVLLRARDVFEKNMNDLYEAGRRCFNETLNSCKPPKLVDFPLVWPRLSTDKLCELKRDDALRKGYYPGEYYDLAKSRNLVPIIGDTPNGIGIVGYNDCESEY